MAWRAVSRCGRSPAGWAGPRRPSLARCAAWRCSPLSSLWRRHGGAASDASTQAGEAGALRTAPPGRGGQARAALVTSADLGLAGDRVPRPAGDAGVPRDDLPVLVRAGPRRPAQKTHPLPATRPRHPPPVGTLDHERPGPAPGHDPHQPTSSRGQRRAVPGTGKATSSSAST